MGGDLIEFDTRELSKVVVSLGDVFEDAEDGTCVGCGAAPRDPISGLCATCTDERCPRCHLVECSPECITAEQAEVDADDGPRPKKFA